MKLEDYIGEEVWVNKAHNWYVLVDVIEGKSGDKYALIKDDNDDIKIIEASELGGYYNKFSKEYRGIEI